MQLLCKLRNCLAKAGVAGIARLEQMGRFSLKKSRLPLVTKPFVSRVLADEFIGEFHRETYDGNGFGNARGKWFQDEQTVNLATDDTMLLLCRGTKTRVAWRDKLLAPFRLWRTASEKTRFE